MSDGMEEYARGLGTASDGYHEPKGTFACPICGVGVPHGHSPLEIEQHKRIAALGQSLADMTDDYMRCHKEATDRYERIVALEAQLNEAQQGESVEQGMRKECEATIAALKADLARTTQERDEALSLAHSRALTIERHEAAIAAAVAKEREACAAIADWYAKPVVPTVQKVTASLIADAIRARKEGI